MALFYLSFGMKVGLAFVGGITSILWGLFPWNASVIAATEAQLRACANAVVFELEGVPRSEVEVFPASPAAESEIAWQTQDGRAGSCWVESGEVIDFVIDRVAITHPRPTVTYLLDDRAGATVTVATEGGTLNVRQSPGGEIMRTVAAGTTLILTGQTSGEWIEVEGGGWVSRFLVSAGDIAPDSLISNPGGQPSSSELDFDQAIVATEGSGLYVRRTPDGEVIDSLADGAIVTLTGQRSGKWVEIEGGGWLAEDYLQYP